MRSPRRSSTIFLRVAGGHTEADVHALLLIAGEVALAKGPFSQVLEFLRSVLIERMAIVSSRCRHPDAIPYR